MYDKGQLEKELEKAGGLLLASGALGCDPVPKTELMERSRLEVNGFWECLKTFLMDTLELDDPVLLLLVPMVVLRKSAHIEIALCTIPACLYDKRMWDSVFAAVYQTTPGLTCAARQTFAPGAPC